MACTGQISPFPFTREQWYVGDAKFSSVRCQETWARAARRSWTKLAARSSAPGFPSQSLNGSGEEQSSDLASRIAGILPNAKLKKQLGTQRMKRSIGIDYGLERTGIAVTFCGFAPRPLSVVDLKGDSLIRKLLFVAKKHKADEFIVGLPRSWDAQETEQSNKTRTFAGRLAQWSAEDGIRVFLQDEYMTSEDALEFMIYRGSTKKSRRLEVDAYAAMIILETYFENDGRLAQLMIPKRGELQEKLCSVYYSRLAGADDGYSDDDDDGADDT